jgi:hypothetical protein
MADPDQLERLKQSVEDWNAWRNENPSLQVDLSNADLRGASLRGVNLSKVDLHKTLLHGADLYDAHLWRADLSKAILHEACLIRARLWDANLRDASLIEADLRAADLIEADLSGADLRGADLSLARLWNANLRDMTIENTIFSTVGLNLAKGLAEIQHTGPSRVELHTIQLPQDGSALHFLRGVGVPDEWIDFWQTIMMYPIQYHSCFVSYSSKDETLARRLHADLQDQGVRCWFAPEDLKIGDKFRQRVDEAIHLQDKLLLLLSEHSIASTWVENEVEAALEKEDRQQREILFPIRLDDAVMHTSQAWAGILRRTRYIGDFTHWTDPQAYQQAFQRLLRDLKIGVK